MATGKNKQQSEHKTQSGHQRTVTQSLPPYRLYYSFADALKIVRSKVPNCTADYLLYCGLMGKVKFFLHVPNELNVFTVCESSVQWNNLTYPPRLLILDRQDCGVIEWNNKTIQSSFPSGYWFNGVHFQEIYPKLDQFWPKQEIAWCIFEKVSYELFRRNQTDSKSEGNSQSEKWNKAIIAPVSPNRTDFHVEISTIQDKNKAVGMLNPQTTSIVKAIELPITEKSLFVMHNELTQLIQNEVTSIEFATQITSEAIHEESIYQKTLKAGLSAPRPFQLHKRSKDYLSPNIYFTLKEAVEALIPQHPECTAIRLLEFGFTNKLTFMTPVPVGVYLIVDKYMIGPPDSSDITTWLTPQLLKVESTECETILREGKVSLGGFNRGHCYSFAPFDLVPAVRSDGSPSNFYLWATWHKDQPHEIAISTDRLFLLQSDLANLVLNEPGPWKTDVDGRQDIHESFLVQPAENPGTNEAQSPTKINEAIADSSEQRPATLSEGQLMDRLKLSRSTINAYQNENENDKGYYDLSFPKKRRVPGSSRRVEYLESEVSRWETRLK